MKALDMTVVFESIHRMPSLPVVVMELLASMDQDEVPVGALASKISQDQALTAKTLRLANSSFYGRTQRVNSMSEAISILGFRAVRSIVTTAGVIQTVPGNLVNPHALHPFWCHAIATAVCARELAPHLQVSADHAYTAGLLHDIGRLILVSQFPQHYAAVLDYRAAQDCAMLDAEQEVLGLDHTAIGAALANYWKFSGAMQLAIGGHHMVNTAANHPLCATFHLANVLAHGLDMAADNPTDAVPTIAPAAWALLPKESDTMLGIFSRIETLYAGAIQILND